MLRINTLGGLWIERDGRRVDGNSPRRSALLAVLATAGERGVSRDRLLLFLWPDATEDRGRHSLSQTIYSINRQLGGEVVVTAGAELRLDPAISSDIAEFLAAHRAGDIATVADRYHGPFLDGFILSDAAEFEEWASGERRRLERIACEAMERLAATDPNGPQAVSLWRRLTAIDPLATRYAVALARATAMAGDPGAAIKQLRAHQQFLRSETGAPPPAEVTNLLAELAAAPIAAPRSSPQTTQSDDGVALATEPSDPPPTPASPVAEPPRRARRIPRAAGLLAVAALAAVVITRRQSAAKPLDDGAMVVLADVENLTADSTLGPALTVAASVALQQSPGFSLYPRSRFAQSLRRLGRGFADTVLSEDLAKEIALRESGKAIVVVSVAPLGGRLLLAGRVIEPANGVTITARRENVDSTPELLNGLDRLMGWVRQQLGDAEWDAAPPLPLVTTSSLAALREFADAGQKYRRGEYDASRTAFERAIAADTGFAMAQVGLGNLLIFVNEVRPGLHWLGQAKARGTRLTEQERLDVDLLSARAEGRTADAIAAGASLTARFPSVVRWYNYGEALRAVGRFDDARTALSRAIALDSSFAYAHQSMAMVNSALGDARGAIDAYDRTWRADSTLLLRDFSNQQWGGMFVDVGDFAKAESVFRKMLTQTDARPRARGYRSLGYLSLRRGHYREGVARLDSAVALYREPSLSQFRDLVLQADAALGRGDLATANRSLDRAVSFFRRGEMEVPYQTLLGRQLIRADRLHEAGIVLDSVRAGAALRPDHQDDQEGYAILAADMALARGRPREALERLVGRTSGTLGIHAGRLVQIDAMVELGMLDSALAVAKQLVDPVPFGVEGMQDVFRGFIRLARVATALGDSATARQAYSALLAHWKDGDRDLPLLVEARTELTRLQGATAR